MKVAKKNIVVLLLDTLRASDAYGSGNLRTLDSISRNATKYTSAVAPGTWTAPTHAALFTNRSVSNIKNVSQDFLSNGTYKIDPWLVKTKFLQEQENTIARKMSIQGYQSVLMSNNPFLTSYTNLAVGFDRVQDIWMHTNIKYNKRMLKRFSPILNGGAKARVAMINVGYACTRLLPKTLMDMTYLKSRRMLYKGTSKVDGTYRLDRGAMDTNKIIGSYLKYNYSYKPQFIFVNYMEAHEHYPVHDRNIVQDKWMYLGGIEEMSEYNMGRLHNGYLKRLRYLDKSIRSTLASLKENGILDNATVIITSDHGQFFGEHGLLYHSLPPYEGVARVPLIAVNYENGRIVKMKDVVDTPVSISALHDSILNLASGKHDYLNGNLRKDRHVICEHTGISEGWDEKLLRMMAPRSKSAAQILKIKRKYNIKVTAVYRKNIKLMHYFGRKKDELYDVLKDPDESSNIIDQNRGLAIEMSKAAYN
ncbi:MAG: sulfatase-like hydrolase/transferase [Candidatus Micrarchaeaceae archaeon]